MTTTMQTVPVTGRHMAWVRDVAAVLALAATLATSASVPAMRVDGPQAQIENLDAAICRTRLDPAQLTTAQKARARRRQLGKQQFNEADRGSAGRTPGEAVGDPR